MAAAGAVVSGPPLRPVSRVLLLLGLAFQWVGDASIAAAAVAGQTLGSDSPVFLTFLVTVHAGNVLCVALQVVAYSLEFLLLPAASRAKASAVLKEIRNDMSWKRSCQAFGEFIRELLKYPTVLGVLACVFLLVLGVLMVAVVPVEACRLFGLAAFNLAVLGISGLFCIIIIPNRALELWKTKVSETKKKEEDVEGQLEAELPVLKFGDI